MHQMHKSISIFKRIANCRKMKKIIIALLIACSFCSKLSAQTDSLKIEILNYQDSKSLIIAKGRSLLLDKFLQNDINKVKELLGYLLTKEEDQNYMAFYPAEKWLLYYWTQQYDKIVKGALTDSFNSRDFYTKIRPPQDLLFLQLKTTLKEQQTGIKNQINASDLSKIDKDFLKLNFDYLLADLRPFATGQDSLNKSANEFLSAYPKTSYEDYVRNNIRRQLKPSKMAFAFEFFSGYGIFTNDLKKQFNNTVPIGIAFDVYYKNFVLYLRDFIGFSKTKDSIVFPLGTWKKGAQARVFLPEASLGYVLWDNRFFKAAPFIGISSTNISPTEYDKNKTPEYENVELKFTTTFTTGLNLDIKLGKTNSAMVTAGPENAYWLLRVRYAYNQPQFHKKYTGFNGNLHYLTIGIGGFGRPLKRDY